MKKVIMILVSMLFSAVMFAATATPTPGINYPIKAKWGLDGCLWTDSHASEKTQDILIIVSPTPQPAYCSLSSMPYYLSPTAALGYPAEQCNLGIRGVEINTNSTTGQIYIYSTITAQAGGAPIAVCYPTAFQGHSVSVDMHEDLLAGEPIVVSMTALSASSYVWIKIIYKIETPQWRSYNP